MPKQNKALSIIQKRLANAAARLDSVEREISMLTEVQKELTTAYQKPKRAAKPKSSLPETRTGTDV